MSYIAGIGIDRRSVDMRLIRKATGQWVSGGDYQRTDADPVPIRAVIQPMSGKQVMDLPEGIREEAQWIVWSRSELKMEDIIDRSTEVQTTGQYRGLLLLTYAGVSWDQGERLKLMRVWPRDEGSFYRAAAGLIK